MATYNSLVNRTDSAALIPEVVSREIIKNVPQASAIMRLGRKLPNMSSAQTRMPVLSSLVTAHFLTGSALVDRDTGLKQTTEAAWDNKYLNAEEIAAIIPIPENVLDDAGYDVWGEIKPNLEEALGAVFDAAVLYGTNAPSSWPTAIVPGALAAGNSVALGSVGDLYDDIMAEGGVLNLVEVDGYMPTGHVAALSMKGKLRGLRGDDGTPIFTATMTGNGSGAMQGPTRYELDGSPIEFPTNGAVDPTESLLVSGDYKQLVYALRQDITYKVLDQAVIQDANGTIIYNLAQQDMVALRVVMRIAWQIPNPINRVQSTEANRYPFAVLVP